MDDFKHDFDTLMECLEFSTPGEWKWWSSEQPPFVVGNDVSVNIGVQCKNPMDAAFACQAHTFFRKHGDLLRKLLDEKK